METGPLEQRRRHTAPIAALENTPLRRRNPPRARILVPRENMVPVEALPVRAPARVMPGSGDRRASLLPVATVIAKLVTTASQNPLQTPKMSAAVTSTTAPPDRQHRPLSPPVHFQLAGLRKKRELVSI